MFERYTERAQKVIYLAQEEARQMRHPAVGTEHILLGLLGEGSGVGAKALEALGLNLNEVRQAVIAMVQPGAQPIGNEIGITPRAKKVLVLAQDEANRWGVNYVGTEHILLGLIREGEGIASQVLAGLGADPDKIRKQVIAMLGGAAGFELGYLFLGKEFGFWTTYCSLMYSLETWVLERVYPMDAPFTNQPLLELCFAMMLPAVGSALMFNYNASSGGTDIVAMILKKYTSISDIGKALFVSDSVIALAACFFFGIETGMFSLLGLFLKAFVVDSVIESINLCKFFSIVTSKPDEICDFIIKDLHHSSTVVDGQGAFSHQDRKVVLTAVRRGEAVRLRQKCKEIDPHSFMFITNTSEIIGKGFRSD